KQCMIYYVTGYLCKLIKKFAKCETCLNSLSTPEEYSREAVSQLTNIKTMGGLIHPNINFFNMIWDIEVAYEKFAKQVDVLDKTMDHIMQHSCFTFPCVQHKDEIITYAVKYY